MYDTSDFSAPVWSTGRVLTSQLTAQRMPHTFVIHCGADPNMAVDGPFFAIDDVYLALLRKGEGLTLAVR